MNTTVAVLMLKTGVAALKKLEVRHFVAFQGKRRIIGNEKIIIPFSKKCGTSVSFRGTRVF